MYGSTPNKPWQLQVFAVSIRKKEKWRWTKVEIEKVLKSERRRCLDVGTGVGTLGHLQEQLGGSWEFTETDPTAAEQARKIVQGPVYEIDIFSSKLEAKSYQLITIFDVIEHVPDATAFIKRLSELLKPHGTLILTTPAADHGYYFWRRLAEKVFGIDKTAHGHVVEGFSRQQLETLTMLAQLHLIQLTPFSFFFTEMIELAYNGAYIFKNRARQRAAPGYNLALSPASPADVAAHGWQLRVLRAAYPILRGISLIDRVSPIPPGYEWGLVARKPPSADTIEMALR